MSTLVYCYNKGCGKQFNPNDNNQDACQFHPGNPVFHDALKGWSCCNKKSTDFTQFLSIPGCSRAAHTNQKPPEPEKPKEDEIKTPEPVVYEAKKPPEAAPRPTENEPLIELKRTIAPSLTSALEKLQQTVEASQTENNESDKSIPIGTPCKNATCQARYQDENSNKNKCIFHSGVAIFHEGMKYWSCCERKTSDFDNFLNQAGCTEGSHLWFKESVKGEKVDCRYDFHQTGGYAIVTVYSKNPLPESTSIKANRIKLDINISFEAGNKSFVKALDLYGVIKLEESVVNFYQTKVEIKMKKADAISWSKLEYVPKKN